MAGSLDASVGTRMMGKTLQEGGQHEQLHRVQKAQGLLLGQGEAPWQ